MDEPTNHLDLTTREALSMALNEYEGTVMLVSHDRALLREVCDEFWLVTGGEVRPFDGDLDDYQKWLLEQSKEMARRAREEDRAMLNKPAAVVAPTPAPAAPINRLKLAERAKPLQKRQQQAEQALEAAQQDHARALAALGDTSLAPAARAEQGRQLKTLDERIATLEAQWLALGEQIEAILAG
jgi:ATP-binding cassette subfamily F protein 3